MDSIRQDTRFTLRTLRRHPGFAFVAVLILGLGIGVSTAIFGVANAVLLKPLPYAEPDRLVAVTRVYAPETENRIGDQVSFDDIRAWQEPSQSVVGIGAFFFTRAPVRVGETAYLPNTVNMNAELLPTLGTAPALGSNFEGGVDDFETVIISHAFWQRAFDGAADIVGREIFVGGRPETIRAVLPATFELPRRDSRSYRGPVDIFLPAPPGFGDNPVFWGVARLAPGFNIQQAQAELRNIDAPLREGRAEDRTVRLSPLAEERTRAARQPVLIFLSIGAVLFVIACTNLVNLLLARNTARGQEMVIRRAVGATFGRLVRQQLTESLCLAAVAGAVGLLIAAGGVRVIETLSPLRLPITQGITLDYRVVGFASVISLAAALIAGFVPTFLSSLASSVARPKAAATGATARSFPPMQRALTVVQIGLCVGLLAAAGVLAHSLWRLNTIDRGFQSEQILGFEYTVAGPRESWAPFVRRALEELGSMPGVGTVGAISFLPPETWAGYFVPFRFEGAPPAGSAGGLTVANTLTTSADYFETIGMAVLDGHGFDAGDERGSPPVAIVNEAFVERFLPGEEPIGRMIVSDFDTNVGNGEIAREIVGIVNDTRDRGLNQRPLPTIYLPYGQGTLPYGAIAMRLRVAARALIPEIRRRLAAVNSDVPIVDLEPLDARIRESLREPRFYALLAAVCAAMAVVFIGVGLYGVVAYSVSRRTVEFGVRMALGAPKGRIMRLVLRQGTWMALTGASLGLIVALATTHGLASLLFEVEALDPVSLAAAVIFVVGIAICAALIPARRACELSPMSALRYE